jgi:chromosome segregation ATPase
MAADSRSQRKMERISAWLKPIIGERSKTRQKRSYAEVAREGGHDIDSNACSTLDANSEICGTDVVEGSWEIEVGERELENNRAEIHKRDKELKRMWSEKCDLEKRLRRSERQVESLNQSLQSQKRYVDHMNDNLGRKEELLQTRTKELTGAQTFLTREDAFSGEDAIATVEALNNEMLQAAAYIADSYESDKVKDAESSESDELREACARANDILGENTIELLGSVFHEDDPLVLEIALQSTIASFCSSFIGAWQMEDPQKDKFIAELYEGIRETGKKHLR